MDLEKERLQLARDTEDSRIMLTESNLFDPEGNKWLVARKKEINMSREYEGVRVAIVAADAARMAPDE